MKDCTKQKAAREVCCTETYGRQAKKMMAHMAKSKQIAFLILITVGIIAFLYFDVIINLNNTLFAVKGDGLKNYFNFLYHIKNDPGYFNFEGMNYPYGETIFMVDAHPLFSNILKFLCRNFFDLTPYLTGILNFFMLISLVICSLFVFLILDYYKHPVLISMAGAISITILCSNAILWKYGHYALSYPCFFPISWYLLLKFQEFEYKYKFSIIILINTLFWFYTHNYLGLIILSFTFLFHFFAILLGREKCVRKSLVPIALQVIVPAIAVYCVITFFDTHEGRIDMPYLTGHKASFYSVFLPNHSYLRPIYNAVLDLSPQEKQSWCKVGNYVGMTTNLTIIGVVISILYNLIARKRWILNKLLSKDEAALLLSAVVLLLFSMAIPFRFGLGFLLPTPLKQFVALGRFAWPFYFVIIVLSFNMIRRLLKPDIATGLILFSTVLLFSEGMSQHLEIRKDIVKNCNIFHEGSEMGKEIKTLTRDIDFQDYQAIVPIPFYHGYISLHSYNSTLQSEKISMALSYFSGLPLMSAVLSRPSVLESKKVLQIFAPPYYKKPVVGDLNDKPLLIVSTRQEHTKLEGGLLKRGEGMAESKNFELYRLPVGSLCAPGTNDINCLIETRTIFKKGNNTAYRLKDDPAIDYLSFDELISDKIYRGGGALRLKKDKLNIIYKSKPGQFEANTEYNLSFWYYNYMYDQSFSTIWIEVKDSTDKITHSKYIDPVKSNIYDGDWAYNEITFRVEQKNDHIVLCSNGANLYSDTIYIDELLVMPQDISKFIISGSQ